MWFASEREIICLDPTPFLAAVHHLIFHHNPLVCTMCSWAALPMPAVIFKMISIQPLFNLYQYMSTPIGGTGQQWQVAIIAGVIWIVQRKIGPTETNTFSTLPPRLGKGYLLPLCQCDLLDVYGQQGATSTQRTRPAITRGTDNSLQKTQLGQLTNMLSHSGKVGQGESQPS